MTDKVAEIKALPISRSKQAVEMVRQLGMSKAEAARELGLDRSSVSICAKRNGIAPGVTDAGRRAMSRNAARVLQSAAVRKVNKEAAATAVTKYRSDKGLPDPQVIIDARASGMTYGEIARKFNIKRHQVAGVLRHHRLGGYRYA